MYAKTNIYPNYLLTLVLEKFMQITWTFAWTVCPVNCAVYFRSLFANRKQNKFANIVTHNYLCTMTYYCDTKRHLICMPYSTSNLHKMAEELGIKKCWFHKDHYDIPKRRVAEIEKRCYVVSPILIVNIIKGEYPKK